jgi:hypothetical protein
MEGYSIEIQVHRTASGSMMLEHTVHFHTRRMLHDRDKFMEGIELLLKIDEELEAGRPPVKFDTICEKK